MNNARPVYHFYGLHVDLRACPWPKQLLPKNVWHKKKRFSHPNHRTDRFGCLCSQGTCNPFVNESWKFKTDGKKKRKRKIGEIYCCIFDCLGQYLHIRTACLLMAYASFVLASSPNPVQSQAIDSPRLQAAPGHHQQIRWHPAEIRICISIVALCFFCIS